MLNNQPKTGGKPIEQKVVIVESSRDSSGISASRINVTRSDVHNVLDNMVAQNLKAFEKDAQVYSALKALVISKGSDHIGSAISYLEKVPHPKAQLLSGYADHIQSAINHVYPKEQREKDAKLAAATLVHSDLKTQTMVKATKNTKGGLDFKLAGQLVAYSDGTNKVHYV